MLKRHRGEPLRIAFLLVPQFSMMAFSSALEPLRSANRKAECPLFEWRLISADGGPVTASNHIPIAVHGPLEQLDKVDLLVACVGLDPTQFGRSHKVHHHLRRLARHGTLVGGISTGSFILADAGLLTRRRCTVHWEYADLLRSRYPTLEVRHDLYIVDQDVFTCSGGTAALDLMLHFIGEACGPQLARAVAEQFIHPRIRRREEGQRVERHMRYGVDNPRLVAIIGHMEGSIDERLDLSDVAHDAGISVRQVERLFRSHIGLSPTTFYRQLRLAKARALLRETRSPVQSVALECGFASTSHFSHAYKRVFGLPPTGERRRPAESRTEP